MATQLLPIFSLVLVQLQSKHTSPLEALLQESKLPPRSPIFDYSPRLQNECSPVQVVYDPNLTHVLRDAVVCIT